jgi:hypothetical protein
MGFFELQPNKNTISTGGYCKRTKNFKGGLFGVVLQFYGNVKRLHIVGNSRKPRCFKNIKKLAIDYETNNHHE